MTLTQAGIWYVCINFGDTNLCCVASGLSWFYTREGTDYPETGGTAQIVSRLASGLVDSLTMTSPARGTFTKRDLDTANTETVTLTDAQEITSHDEPTEDQWCYAITTGSISFTSSPSGARIYLNGVDQGMNTPATITDISAGTHSYKLSLSGYEDCLGNVHVTAGETAGVNCDMIPITGAIGDIKGRVIDRFDNPILNAKAVIIETGQFDYTDDAGYFVITSVPVGTHTIEISKEDYDFEYIEVNIAEGFNELVEPVTLYTGWIPSISPVMIAGVAVLAGIIGSIILKR